MAVKFRKYHRFDAAKAEYGVEHTITDEVGNVYGTFKTSLFDIHSKYIQTATERFNRENGDNPKFKGEHANTFAFIEICLHDWKDVLDENGKQVKFSKEEAFELLKDSENSFLLNTLIAMSRDVALYKVDPVAKQEEVAGN